MVPELISTTSDLKVFLDYLPRCTGQPPSLYVDLEGNKPSRLGTLSLVTILLMPLKEVFLIDVTSLQGAAFNTEGSTGRTLKSILESKRIVKVFFDVQRDSDALFSHYGVNLDGVEDVQLMQLASGSLTKRWLADLPMCIERDSKIGQEVKQRWQSAQEKGRKLFDPELGGSYAVFDERPLSQEIWEYCIQNVVCLPHLRNVYLAKLCDFAWEKVEEETESRIQISQSTTFDPNANDIILGPRGWWTPGVERMWQWFLNNKGDLSRAMLDKAIMPSPINVLTMMPSGLIIEVDMEPGETEQCSELGPKGGQKSARGGAGNGRGGKAKARTDPASASEAGSSILAPKQDGSKVAKASRTKRLSTDSIDMEDLE